MNQADVLSVMTDLPGALLITGPRAGQAGYQVYARNCGTCGTVISSLTVDVARDIQAQAYRATPPGERFRVFLVSLDGASDQALNALLKVLEEPPAPARFVLTATRRTLVTIVSRCYVLSLGRAENPEGPDSRVRSSVSTAIKAARAGTPGLLSMTLRGWDAACTAGLAAWAAEAAAGRWRAYDGDFAPGVTSGEALQVLTVLRAYRGARTAPAVALTRAFCQG